MDDSGEITELWAAQYARMSTEHQRFSPNNQSDEIRQYTERHCIEIIRTYPYGGKSGLAVGGHAAL